MREQPRIPALDGVRALAVGAVLLAHAGIPGVTGGFVGVDVFFVLSGFLITSLLLDERNRDGRVGLGAFWARRARRLLPAALVMIAAVVAARPLVRPDALGGLRWDALTASLWSSNWRFALQGTDYFSTGTTPSPLQHTWSLGVEEQFYIIWPCLLLLLFAGSLGAKMRANRLFGLALIGTGVSAGVTYALSERAAPGRVYFGTDTRAQELLMGAALAALLAPTWSWASRRRRASRSPQRASARNLPLIMSVVGLAVLAVVAHVADGSPHEFQYGLMLVVSLASALLIAGLMLDRRMPVSRLLASAPLRGLGRISYSVYLWHWPLFQLLSGERTGLRTYQLAGARIALTLGVAALSYFVIERPALLVPLRPVRVLPAAALGMAAVVAFSLLTVPTGPGVPRVSRDSLDLAAGAPGQVPPGGGPGGGAGAGAASPVAQHAAPHVKPHAGPLHVDIFGDSIGWTLAQYLPKLDNITIANETTLGCGIVRGGAYEYFGQHYDQPPTCDTWPTRWADQVQADHPDEVLLVVGRWELMDRTYQQQWTHVGETAYDAYLTGLLKQAIDVLGSSGARVIVANEPYNRRGEQPDGSLYPEDNPARVDAWNRIVQAALASHPEAMLLDLNNKLCPDGHFTWDVDGVQVRSDGVHISPSGADWLAPWISEQFQKDTW